MNIRAYVAAGCVVMSAAAMHVGAEEWSESTLYVTRTGPAQSAVQQREPLLAVKDEAAQETPEARERSADETGTAPAESALERGIVRAAAAPRMAEPAARTGRETTSAAEPAATPAGRAASLLRRRTERPAAAAAATVAIDKFVDQNKDGYDDRTQADDL